jgi:Fuc2NAc and GlcNAc transferase
LVHLGAAALFVLCCTRLGGFTVSLTLAGWRVESGWLLGFISVVAITWMINLYNFMDGSDGLAGIEALTVAGLGAAFCFWRGDSTLASIYLGLALASSGFLLFNWSPARIFMGDVGSGFLGFCFGALAFAGEWSGTLPITASLILLGTFVVDATYTLVRRLAAGQKVYQAHRDHAYQHMIQGGRTHRQVATIYALINLFWLGPCAFLSVIYPNAAPVILLIAYLPLIAMEYRFRAGISPRPRD